MVARYTDEIDRLLHRIRDEVLTTGDMIHLDGFLTSIETYNNELRDALTKEDAFTFAEGVARHYCGLRRNLVPEDAAERLTLDYQRMMLGIVTDD